MCRSGVLVAPSVNVRPKVYKEIGRALHVLMGPALQGHNLAPPLVAIPDTPYRYLSTPLLRHLLQQLRHDGVLALRRLKERPQHTSDVFETLEDLPGLHPTHGWGG